jgi:Ca2+-binding RTX toxin-like protein
LIYSGSGNFIGGGSDQDNTIIGAAGDDVLTGNGGADHLVGGNGIDTASYSTAVTANLATMIGTGDALGDTYDSIENLTGSGGNDHLTGDSGNNILSGGAGNDMLIGGAGADVLNGGADIDTLIGGAGADALNGGASIDRVIYTGSSAGVNIIEAGGSTGGDAEGDTFDNIEIYYGSNYDDTFAMAQANRTVYGGLGNDTYILSNAGVIVTEAANEGIDTVQTTLVTYTLLPNFENLTYTGSSNFRGYGNSSDNIIISQGEADTLFGYNGNDLIIAGDGGDIIDGGSGSDTSSYQNSTAAVSINLAAGSASGGYAQYEQLTSIENLIGSAYNDTLTGDANANSLSGLAGNDVISGGDGDDTIDGGAGADTLTGGNGTDTLTYAASTTGVAINLVNGVNSSGDAAGDVFSGFEKIVGSSGNDTFTAAGVITLEGGNGNDTYIIDGSGVTVIEGATGGFDTVRTSLSGYTLDANIESVVYTGTTAVTLIGNAFDNSLTGGAGDDTLSGGDGNDVLIGGVGADVLDGGAGRDTVSYAASSAAVSVNLGTLAVSGGDAAGDTLNGIEVVIGSAYADTLAANAASTLAGGAGDDLYIVTGSGVVISEGSSAGIDTVETTLNSYALASNIDNLTFTGTGNVTATGNGLANILTGGLGNDVLIGGGGADTLDGGLGTDTASYANASAGVTVDLSTGVNTGDAAGDIYSSIESFVGSSNADVLIGDANANAFNGGNGNDILVGGLGADLLNGGGGTDTADYSASSAAISVDLITGAGLGGDAGGDLLTSIERIVGSSYGDTFTTATTVTFVGGLGDDTYILGASASTVTEAAGEGIDTISTGSASWTLGANIENLTYSGSAAFAGTGNELDNAITGGIGADTLSGAAGNDVLSGGEEADILSGGAGADLLSGGLGGDTFVYAAGDSNTADGVDVIGDFSQADGDHIDLAGLGTLTLVDTTAFGGTAGELRYEVLGSDTFVFADLDGDSVADVEIEITGSLALAASDFLL